MQATITWPVGTAYLRVNVGAAGYSLSATQGAGTGGNASSIAALDANGGVLALILMSGGGGGGGISTVDV